MTRKIEEQLSLKSRRDSNLDHSGDDGTTNPCRLPYHEKVQFVFAKNRLEVGIFLFETIVILTKSKPQPKNDKSWP